MRYTLDDLKAIKDRCYYLAAVKNDKIESVHAISQQHAEQAFGQPQLHHQQIQRHAAEISADRNGHSAPAECACRERNHANESF